MFVYYQQYLPRDIVIEQAAKSTYQIKRGVFPSESFHPVVQNDSPVPGIEFQHPGHLSVDPGIFTQDIHKSD